MHVTTVCWIGPIAGNMQPPGPAAHEAGGNKNANQTVAAKLLDGWDWVVCVLGQDVGLF